MTLNRLVVLLTPLVFAPLAGASAAWLADHIPGYQVDSGALEEIFIAGALIALAPAAQWLHGWQKFEARQAELQRDVAIATAAQPAAVGDGFAADPELSGEDAPELGDLGDFDDFDELDELEELAQLDELDMEMFANGETPATASR